jgi:hypothetical protein
MAVEDWLQFSTRTSLIDSYRPKAVITVNRPLTQMQREQPSTIASRTAAIGQDRSYAVK